MDKGNLASKIREEMESIASRYGEAVGKTHIGRLAMVVGNPAPASIIVEREQPRPGQARNLLKEKESHAI